MSPSPRLRGAAGAALLLVSWTADARAEEKAPRARVLTISGGISLGAYEAGYNWAWVRDLKERRAHPEPGSGDEFLAGVTGASAGSINAFLTAISWCQSPEVDRSETAEQNALWQVWTDIGWERLFPTPGMTCTEYRDQNDPQLDCTGDPSRAYLPDDGVFTRRAFEAVERDIAQRINGASRFVAGCKVPVGITVTKVVPDTLFLGDNGHSGARQLQIGTQRFAIALSARTDSAGLGFYARKLSPDDGKEAVPEIPEDPKVVGKYLRLPSDASGRVRVARSSDRTLFTLFDALEASSAFPVAFGPKLLQYCVREEGEATSASCPQGYKLTSAQFVDGGVFDNIPLGLATTFVTRPVKQGDDRVVSLAAAEPKAEPEPELSFHYIDPDTLRYSAAAKPVIENGRGDLMFLSRLFGNFISVGRQYELQTVRRFGWSTKHEFYLSSRFAPIFGEQLGAFGAFAGRIFRQYDYFAGVYDALQDHAQEVCATFKNETERQRCKVAEVYKAHQRLQLGVTPSTSYVVRQLLLHELIVVMGEASARALLARPISGNDGPSFRDWIDAAQALEVAPWLRKLASDGGRGAHAHAGKASAMARFKAMVAPLGQDPSVLGAELTPAEREVIRDTEGWLWLASSQILDRLHAIESTPADSDTPKIGRALFAMGEEFTRTKISDRRRGGFVGPGTGIGYWLLLPHNATLFPGRGGFEASWDPGILFTEHLGVSAPVVPFTWWRGSHLSVAVGLNAMVRATWPTVFLMEAGPRGYFDYKRFDDVSFDSVSHFAWGLDAGAYVLGGKLRFGVTMRTFPGRPADDWRPELTFSLADLPGIARTAWRSF